MIKRLLTSFVLSAIIFLIIFSYNIWIFSVSIVSICLFSFYEWIKNDFKNNYFGFLLIFNFGFWSIFYTSIDNSAYVFYGLIILNTACFDTFAYLVGSKFGKTYIAKDISPNKTLEGFIGGSMVSVSLGCLAGYIFNMYILIIIFVIGSISAFIGDLLISYFKRKSGVKDTGTILPGHGGVLDRVDSHLLATPILIVILIIMLWRIFYY